MIFDIYLHSYITIYCFVTLLHPVLSINSTQLLCVCVCICMCELIPKGSTLMRFSEMISRLISYRNLIMLIQYAIFLKGSMCMHFFSNNIYRPTVYI